MMTDIFNQQSERHNKVFFINPDVNTLVINVDSSGITNPIL
jgi:hypothetical protein